MTYIFTDLDGTFIPEDRESEDALHTFRELIDSLKISIIYVTGRNLQEAKSAIKKYKLPKPNAIICDVGTTIYYKKALKYTKDISYSNHLRSITKKCNNKTIMGLFKGNIGLIIQEFYKQKRFKVSFYFKKDSINIDVISDKLKAKPWDYIISYSNDGVGLLDIIPENTSKLSAVNWITHKLSNKELVMFAGDSGNDMKVFESNINSIVVSNTAEEIKNKIIDRDNIYISSKKYTNGVLDGYYYYKKREA